MDCVVLSLQRLRWVFAPLIVAGLLVAGLTTTSYGGEAVAVEVPAHVLDQYLLARTAPGVTRIAPVPTAIERPMALSDGQYAVIGPTFTGADGNVSYIRFFNTIASWGPVTPSLTFQISVIGSPSGRIYGAANIQVPASAAPQYPLSDILTQAGAAPLSGGDTAYSLYLAQTDPNVRSAGYQHVIYNNANGFFENVTICGHYQSTKSVTQQVLTNVHSSAITSYPAQVFIHNYQSTPVTYQVHVVDARTGVSLGQISLETAANAYYVIPETFFEQQLNWTPRADQGHINLFFENSPSATVQNPVNAAIGQFIVNQRLSARINMSVSCRVSAG